MYVYIYLIRREGLELRWKVRREGFLTYDIYFTRCKFLRREEPKTCIGWDLYDVCSNKIYIGWAFFTSGGISTMSVVVKFATGGLFLHRVRFFTLGGDILQTTFTSGFPQSHVATRSTMIIGNINDIDDRRRSTTIDDNRRRSTTIDDDRRRSLTTLTNEIDRRQSLTTLTNDNDRRQQ